MTVGAKEIIKNHPDPSSQTFKKQTKKPSQKASPGGCTCTFNLLPYHWLELDVRSRQIFSHPPALATHPPVSGLDAILAGGAGFLRSHGHVSCCLAIRHGGSGQNVGWACVRFRRRGAPIFNRGPAVGANDAKSMFTLTAA